MSTPEQGRPNSEMRISGPDVIPFETSAAGDERLASEDAREMDIDGIGDDEDEIDWPLLETIGASKAALPDPPCPYCGMTAQVEPSRSEPGRWMCHGCAQPFDALPDPPEARDPMDFTSSPDARLASEGARGETLVGDLCGKRHTRDDRRCVLPADHLGRHAFYAADAPSAPVPQEWAATIRDIALEVQSRFPTKADRILYALAEGVSALVRAEERAERERRRANDWMRYHDAMTVRAEAAEERVAALREERDEWKRKAELSKWPKEAASEYHRYRHTLEVIAKTQPRPGLCVALPQLAREALSPGGADE